MVYKLDAAGQETVLYTFPFGADGAPPEAGVIRDPAGDLYGTAGGGTANAGVVYKLDTAGHQTVLYRFTGGVDGPSLCGSDPRLGRPPLRDHSQRRHGERGRGVQTGRGGPGDRAA